MHFLRLHHGICRLLQFPHTTWLRIHHVPEAEIADIVYEVLNSPYEGENGNWWIGEEDTGIAHDESVVPEINFETGTWWIGGVDTNIAVEIVIIEDDEEAPSEDEETPDTGENGMFTVVIAVLAVMMGAAMVLFSKKNNVTE